MFVLRAVEKPRYAKKSSDEFYYRDRARADCEGIKEATKFATEAEAEDANNGDYIVVEVE